jgi:2-polyprenyl-6-hydroxyphenyl methylase/3-demethylubiquinone-9 3-methyltransferase
VSEWREAVWAAVPEGAVPERFEERRDWLLGFASPGDRVLDLGCGDGSFAAAMAGAGAQVTMADVAQAALERAREAAPGGEAVLLAEDVPLPFGDAAFDLAWCGETLEHVVDVAGLAGELRRVLRPGATLLVTTPNQPRLAMAIEALGGRGLEERLDPRADHLRFFTARTLAALLRGAGFSEVAVEPWDGMPGFRRRLRAVAR